MDTLCAEYASGLRLLADWVEAHPGIDLPSTSLSVYSLNSKEKAATCLLALKPCEKKYDGDLFRISRKFGPITLSYVFTRSAVCNKKLVGTKVIPETVKPAEPEEIIPEHEEEIYEWVCDEPILNGSGT